MFRVPFALAVLAALAGAADAADAMTKAKAEAAVVRFKDIKAFADAQVLARFTAALTQGTANSKAYTTQCAAASVKCENNAEKSICCDGDNKECKYDANGKEYPMGCLEPCAKDAATQTAEEKEMCSSVAGMKKYRTISVCGTSAASCVACMAGTSGVAINPEWITRQEDCEDKGLCKVGTFYNPESKAADCKGTFYKGVWTPMTAKKDKASCFADAKCFKCIGGDADDEARCLSKGSCARNAIPTEHNNKAECEAPPTPTWTPATWTPATWTEVTTATDKDSCELGANQNWLQEANWVEGNGLPDETVMGKGTKCSTGPSHSEPSHILMAAEKVDGEDKKRMQCVSEVQFLKDGTAKTTVTAATAANQAYYADVSRQMLAAVKVVNPAGVADRASMIFTKDTCFVFISDAYNAGKLTINGGDKTFALITNPTNVAGPDALTVTGGSAMILGGTNAAKIVSTTAGSLDIHGVANTGSLIVSKSQSIVIADTTNTGGTITVTDVSVTLIDVTSSGKIVASGAAGKYVAYNIVNTGTITISAGTIDLHFKCNTGGTVTIGDSVTGKISYEAGCKGTITAPAAVTVTGAAATVVTQVVKTEVATFATNVKIADPKKFDEKKYMAALATSTGVKASEVKVVKKEFIVEVGFKFTADATVTLADAKKAIAAAWGVAESQVTVIITAAGRRLATDTAVTATLTTTDAANTDKAMATDQTAVTTQLKTVANVVATTVVAKAAAATVKVTTKVEAEKKITQPTATELATIATASGGTGAAVDGFVQTQGTKTMGASLAQRSSVLLAFALIGMMTAQH